MPEGAFTFTSSGRPKRVATNKKRRRTSDDEEPDSKKKSPLATSEGPQAGSKSKSSYLVPLIFNHLN